MDSKGLTRLCILDCGKNYFHCHNLVVLYLSNPPSWQDDSRALALTAQYLPH